MRETGNPLGGEQCNNCMHIIAVVQIFIRYGSIPALRQMARRYCSAPGCHTGYSGNKNPEKVSLFKVPDNKVKEWSKLVPGIKLSINSALCEKHFSKEDVMREVVTETYSYPLRIPRLKEGAKPSIWPNCPIYLSKELLKIRKANEAKEPLKKRRVNEGQDCVLNYVPPEKAYHSRRFVLKTAVPTENFPKNTPTAEKQNVRFDGLRNDIRKRLNKCRKQIVEIDMILTGSRPLSRENLPAIRAVTDDKIPYSIVPHTAKWQRPRKKPNEHAKELQQMLGTEGGTSGQTLEHDLEEEKPKLQ